ncbi:MAG: nitronate monooxygenase [Kineosporiaceae bacterium]|nr:nitronate monooxygenase [Aeromicrobium sp.]
MERAVNELSVGDVPVIVAPMAGGPSTPALVVAAAAAGALGFLAAGYKSVEIMAGEIAAVRDSTDHFGVNVFVPDDSPVDRAAIERYRDRLRPEAERYGVELPEIRWADDDHWSEKISMLIADPVPWVSFTFGVPDSATIRDLKRAGSQVLVTVTDPDEAELAFDSGADGVIAQSGSAGGHSSTTNPALYRGDTTTLDLVAEIRFRVPLPVVAAGGIASRQDLEAVLDTRAFAVQVGTHFLKAVEAGTRPTQREAMGDPRFAETVVTRAFTGRPARALRNRFTDTFSDSAPLGYPAIHHLTAPIRAAAGAQGDPHGINLWAGAGFGYARDGTTAEILASLIG